MLDRKSAVCMSNTGKDNKHIRYISRGVHFVRNGENWKMHNIDWYEGVLQLSDITTKNVGENYFNPRIKYIMGRLENWEMKLVQEGWHDSG